MSHDGDKLIRQLSLVAYLMAERRPVTARDAKQAVEGYSDMSDEAFARRFYADRAELLALGVPLRSNRDEFTGEELYTLAREDYFLPPLHLTDPELAALQTCLYLLEGQFAYSEPLRLALQNLALGRPNPATSTDARSAVTLNLAGGGYSPEIAARLAKLEGAISKQRTIVFQYFAMYKGEEAPRTVDPYSLYFQDSQWYLVARDRDRDDIRVFRVSRIRGDIRFATRRERDFKVPEDFDPASFRDRVAWQFGEPRGEATLHVDPTAAWLIDRLYARHGEVETHEDRSATFTTAWSDADQLVSWIIGMDGRVLPIGPPELVDAVTSALERARDAHEGEPPEPAGPVRIVGEDEADPAARRVGPVAPERFAVLQALMADLLERCGSGQSGEASIAELGGRYGISEDQVVDQINLLNLVNFGGGCYAVYAEIDQDAGVVRVEKELYGDEFRRPARLSPLEAKAILMALDLVGPQVAAGAGTTLRAVRDKVEEAFGGYALRELPTGDAVITVSDHEEILSALNAAIMGRRLVRIGYLSRTGSGRTDREIEPYLLRGVGSDWYVESYDRSNDGERTFRVDRIETAELLSEAFEPREGLEIAAEQRAPQGRNGTAQVWWSAAIALRELERRPGSSVHADGSASSTVSFGSQRWLYTEVIKHRGEAVLLDPRELRAGVAERAAELLAQVVAGAPASA